MWKRRRHTPNHFFATFIVCILLHIIGKKRKKESQHVSFQSIYTKQRTLFSRVECAYPPIAIIVVAIAHILPEALYILYFEMKKNEYIVQVCVCTMGMKCINSLFSYCITYTHICFHSQAILKPFCIFFL